MLTKSIRLDLHNFSLTTHKRLREFLLTTFSATDSSLNNLSSLLLLFTVFSLLFNILYPLTNAVQYFAINRGWHNLNTAPIRGYTPTFCPSSVFAQEQITV